MALNRANILESWMLPNYFFFFLISVPSIQRPFRALREITCILKMGYVETNNASQSLQTKLPSLVYLGNGVTNRRGLSHPSNGVSTVCLKP